MITFPYISILKKAYFFTIGRIWLWLFGLLLGGWAISNFGNLESAPRTEHVIRDIIEKYPQFTRWIAEHPGQFALIIFSVAAAGVFLLVIGALAKAAVILAAGVFTDQDRQKTRPEIEANLRSVTAAARRFTWPIVKLNVLAAALMGLLLSIFLVPIGYLVEVGASSRAIILGFFGALIFFPGLIVFWYIRIYGPIFIVLYEARGMQAIQLSFGLLHAKVKESLFFGALIAILSIMFIFLASFSIILFSIPQIAVTTFLTESTSYTILQILLASSFLLLQGFVIVLASAFSVFVTCAWVFAVQEMIRARKLREEKEALAVEPEPVA